VAALRRAAIAGSVLALGAGLGAAASTLRFTDAASAAGLDFRATSGADPSRHVLEVNGGGVALFDFDGDDDLDLFLANGSTLEAPERGPGSRLYRNRGGGTFEDVTERAGIALRRWAMGVAVGDADGDGRDDLYVTCYGPNVLLRNETGPDGPRFRDVTERAGVGDPSWSTSAAFGDVDGDGDLDLYVANYLAFDADAPPPRDRTFQGVSVMPGPQGLEAQPDTLYLNLGDGRFRDASRAWGVRSPEPGYGLGVRMLDFDEDGRLDVFVGNDSTLNFLFHNVGGRFEDVGLRSGIAANADGGAQATMGIGLADVDGNGRFDVFTTNFSHDTNTLHVNLDGRFFDDRTSQFGLGLVSRPFLGWGCGFHDFDADGDEDLFVSNGHVYPETADGRTGTEYEQHAVVFERAGPRFERAADAGPSLAVRYRGRAAAFGDLDDDGDVDVVLTTLGGPVHVLRNDAPHRRVLVVRLEQDGPNPRAYGATVELEVAGRTSRRWIGGDGSFQSADAPVAHFGLGSVAAEAPRTLRVRWPDGARTTIEAPPLDRRIVVRRDGHRTDPLRGRTGR